LKSVILKISNQSAFHKFESSEICKMKWKNLNLIVTSTIILKRFMNQKSVNKFIKFVQFIESAFIIKRSIEVDLNQLWFSQLIEIKKIINIIMIKVAVYWTLVKNKKIKIFFLIISEINKALSSVEDFAKLSINHLMKSAKTDYKLIKLASVKNICLVELLAHKL